MIKIISKEIMKFFYIFLETFWYLNSNMSDIIILSISLVVEFYMVKARHVTCMLSSAIEFNYIKRMLYLQHFHNKF